MADTTGQYMLLVRAYLVAGFEIHGIVAYPLPWGLPRLLGFSGKYVDTSEPGLIIFSEFPQSYFPPYLNAPKHFIERFHVSRFDTDHRMSLGAGFADELAEGADPPDFVVTTNGATRGVECTALSAPGRREVNAFFEAIRTAVLEAPYGAFPGLLGTVVQIGFEPKAGTQGRPFRATDYASIESLLQAMHSYRVGHERFRLTGEGLPQQPDLSVVDRSTGKAEFCGLPLLNNAPDTPFYALRGFELVLGYSSDYRISDATAEVERLVGQHDKPGVDTLLISTGAPDRRGMVHPAEEVFARFYLDHGVAVSGTKHIERILVHLWDTGEAWDILQEKKCLFGPLYEGMVPRHRQWKRPSPA